jgi:pilus assembly protein CpaB
MFVRNALLAIGAIFVLAGVVLIVMWFGQLRNPPAVVETPVVAPQQQQGALVAAHKIPRDTKLGEDDFKDAPGEVHPGSLHRGEEKEFLGKPSRREIAEGEPLMPDDFNPCKLFVEQGYRAISISVDAPQSVAGLVAPNDYVDVLLTQNFDDKVTTDPRRKWAGETVLRDVRVLATDQSLCPPSGVASTVSANTAARTPQTVTLALKERQAEVLMVAERLGTFRLALVQHLESAGAAQSEDRHKAKPVWASDVSPALTEIITPLPPPPPPVVVSPPALGGAPSPCPPASGSPLEQNVRCAPSSSAYYRAPVAPTSGAPTSEPPKPEPHGQWPGMNYAPTK